MLKKCTRCKLDLPVSDFHKDASRKSGIANRCKQCHGEIMRKHKEKDRGKIKQARRAYYEANKDKLRQYYQANREWILAKGKESRSGLEGSIKVMLQSAKQRARAKGLDFDIDADYLLSIAPQFCPVDGQALDWNKELSQNGRSHSTSPSLDRIDSTKGYVKGNVRIIGDQWNRWKSNMSLYDIEKLYHYMRDILHCVDEEKF